MLVVEEQVSIPFGKKLSVSLICLHQDLGAFSIDTLNPLSF